MEYFFIQDPTNNETITVLAGNLEQAQLSVVKSHGLAVSAQVPLFGGIGYSVLEAVRANISVGSSHTVEHYQPLTGKWHREELADGTTWTTDETTAQALAQGYADNGYAANVIEV